MRRLLLSIVCTALCFGSWIGFARAAGESAGTTAPAPAIPGLPASLGAPLPICPAPGTGAASFT